MNCANQGLDGLTKLFGAIRQADRLDDLSQNYKKFAEWLRIEYVH